MHLAKNLTVILALNRSGDGMRKHSTAYSAKYSEYRIVLDIAYKALA
jgi:hypothetical protein